MPARHSRDKNRSVGCGVSGLGRQLRSVYHHSFFATTSSSTTATNDDAAATTTNDESKATSSSSSSMNIPNNKRHIAANILEAQQVIRG
mmetsp:Transcript_56253/g.136372  ORF Transcript_56253/g.136372 Transcript_56253/m.136372 type:complete len:89 (+) Transcript_56253:1086-1352(+)